MLSKILYIFLALLILMILITVHEFGHYIAGKIFKFKINEFSIGFGKAIYKKTKKNGEVFSVRVLPLGGYCAFEGEDQDNPQIDAFNSRPAWQRLIVLFSGVFFNFIFGIITSAIYLSVAGYAVPVVSAVRNDTKMQVTNNYNLELGDKIIAVNGKTVEAYRTISDLLSKNACATTLTLKVERGEEVFDLIIEKKSTDKGYFYVSDATKIVDNLYIKDGSTFIAVKLDDFKQQVINAEVDGEGENMLPSITMPAGEAITFYRLIKNASGEDEYKEYTLSDMKKDGVLAYGGAGLSLGIVYYQQVEHYGFFEALLKAWPFAFYICGVMLGALGGLFTGATKISDMGGTITTISTIAEVSAINPLIILYLFPMLSFNLALFNILPIPALDGARMLFVLWEAVTKKPVNRKVEGMIHTIGLFALLALVVFLDIYHFII